MAANNRRKVSTRLTDTEYQSFVSLCQFWRKPEKEMLAFAVAQLGIVTYQVQQKMNEETAAKGDTPWETSITPPLPES